MAEPSGDSSPESGRLHAIVLADGSAPTRAELSRTWPGWDTGIGLVVAADGGARLAIQLGLVIDRWVGDGDSLDASAIERLRQSGVATTLFATDKDESDTELAVLEAVAAGAAVISILGALGGVRLDHTLANVALLAHPALADRTAHLLDAATRVTLLTGNPAGPETTFEGRIGDTVSLLPLDAAVRGVRTTGLRYPLKDESLELGPARGLSNVRTAESATIAVRSGRLLVVESPATLTP